MIKLQHGRFYQFKEMAVHPLQKQKMRLILGSYALMSSSNKDIYACQHIFTWLDSRVVHQYV